MDIEPTGEGPKVREPVSDIESMTGFGSGQFEVDGVTYRVEIRTVNHRNMNTRFHMPAAFTDAQQAAQTLIKKRLSRGAVDMRVQAETSTGGPGRPQVNHAAVRALMDSLTELAGEMGCQPPSIDAVIRFPDLVSWGSQEVDAEDARETLLAGIEQALDGVDTLRREEGRALATDLAARLETVGAGLELLEGRAPQVLEGYEARLRQRLNEISEKEGLKVDEGRLVTELVLFSDRCDITEEVVRARTHVAQMTDLVNGGGETRERGKRLDFLAQELGRELNTMGAKCRDAGMAGAVVDGKVELERIREQVQNIL